MLEDIERLVADGIAAGDVLEAAIAPRLLTEDAGSVFFKVLARENAAAGLARRRDRIGHRSGIEAGGALVRDARERRREILHRQAIAGLDLSGCARQAATGQEHRRERRH